MTDPTETISRPYADPPELANMSGRFRLGYHQGRQDAALASYEAAKKALDDTPEQSIADGIRIAAIDNMLGALARLAGVPNVSDE